MAGLGSRIIRPNYTEAEKRCIWNRTTSSTQGFSRDEWALDQEGNLIAFLAYGDRRSAYGWEIDHIIPIAVGGSDSINNLRALHWEANARKGVGLSTLAQGY